MGTLVVILLSGLYVSLICMTHLTFSRFRLGDSWIMGNRKNSRQKISDVNWLGIILLSAIVFYAWCLIGIGMHFLLNNEALIQSILLFVLTTCTLIYSVKVIKTVQKPESLGMGMK